MAVALSSDDRAVLDRHLSTGPAILGDDMSLGFEVERCSQWILEHHLSKVTLQFPDCLLPYATKVALDLEKAIGSRVSILGDTSYGDCCVDEVAAEHIGADGLIHFGNACLTPTRRLPVLHIFTELPLDVDQLKTEIESTFETGTNIAIFYDVQYHKAMTSRKDTFAKPNVVICEPTAEQADNVKCGRICPSEIDSSWTILYVGKNENYAFLLGLSFPASSHFMYNTSAESKKIEKSSLNIQKALMKRYYLIERAKDATRIGILVGTLGVTRYSHIIEYVKDAVKRSGKKSYTFLVGKLNVPKLANFTEIDVFVMVACPENSIVDSKDFLVPVITPFELDVALNQNRAWDGSFVANFGDILPKGRHHLPFHPVESESDVSLISGKIRGTTLESNGNSSAALATQVTSVSVLHEAGGGEFLANRSWTGLEQKLGESEVKDAVEGLKGIASGYANEGL